MQTVAAPPYLASAKDDNVSHAEMDAIVDYLANNPDTGDIMAGTGGARKLRFALPGKRSGYRIITFYAADDIPVFLLDIYSKSSQENLSKAERNAMREILSALPDLYRKHRQVERSRNK